MNLNVSDLAIAVLLILHHSARAHPRSSGIQGSRERDLGSQVEGLTISEPVCRNPTLPFDYSSKIRRHEEVPICKLQDTGYLASHIDLLPRQAHPPDDYSCGPGSPCRNGACCPKATGQCNYGPKACGTTGTSPNDVCWSNCDAKAECGRYANPPGKKCPLNVCCSRWGFCGATPDFCKITNDTETSCQSNCNQPGPKNKDGNVQKRIIGYYEAWNHAKACQGMGFGGIPVGALTHAYFSFGYITPGEFKVAPMDNLPVELFDDFTAIKKNNVGLKTIVALGGWTFNDNNTATQPVFSNMVSTAANRKLFIGNLFGFMRKHGFDGVDFDWEYPGAGDRGGKPDDGKNFVQFLKELDQVNKQQPAKYSVSFTIPTSYWYLRHFDLKAVDYVDFVNVMSYDLHGVWDSNNPIGNHIYGHSNITEIDQALKLLWRNNVPANKLNLGLGFYGRSFTLSDPSCTTPGCGFKAGGQKGPCTDASGVLSYREIKSVIKQHKLKPYHDKVAGVKWITWNNDQWVSYDDAETFKQKIKFANDQGLAGLLIWAIDQDTDDLEALSGVVAPRSIKNLARKAEKKAYWEDATVPDCYVTGCGGTCKAGFIKIEQQPCGGAKAVTRHSSEADSLLCCPIDGAPDRKNCQWRGSAPSCNGHCHDNEVAVEMNRWGDGKYCEDGNKVFCCESPASKKHGCYWQGLGKRKCKGDDVAMTFSGTFISFVGDFAKEFGALTGNLLLDAIGTLSSDALKLYCCPKKEAKQWENCAWHGKPGSCFDNHCPIGHSVQLTDSPYGLGMDCFPRMERVRVFCCDPADGKSPFLPVPLSKLFPNPPQGDNVDTSHELLTDDTWGTGKSRNGNDDEPNDAAFSFVVLTSPEELQVSLDKRDGSHWELLNCDSSITHEEEQTIQMVCTDNSEDSNCHKIGLGHGVPGTILQMPPGCGPGKYAVAKQMRPAKHQILPRHLDHLTHKTIVYDLIFDYDFSRVPRDLGNTQLRIDYSNEQGYWDNIVAADVGKKKHKRSLHDVGGNHVRWLEEEFRDDLHFGALSRDEVHKRWFGSSVFEWLRKMVKPEIKKTYTHNIDQTITAKIVEEKWHCAGRDGHLLAQAQTNIKVGTSFGFTLIARSLFPLDIHDSYLIFNNKGEIKSTFTLEALARFGYDSKDQPIIDIPFPGAALRIPGIATIGPALAVKGRIEASVAIAAELEARLDVVSWDYEYRLPAISEMPPANPDRANFDKTGDKNGLMQPTFYAGVLAMGNAKAHLIASLQFGVAFDDRWKVGKATAEVTADGWVEVSVAAGESTSASCPFTWGLDAGIDLYAMAQGFKWQTDRYILPGTAKFKIYPGGQCPDLHGGVPSRRGLVGGSAFSSLDLAERQWERRGLEKRAIGPFFHIPVGELFCPGLNNADANNKTACSTISGWEPDQIEHQLRRRDDIDWLSTVEANTSQSRHHLDRRVTDYSRNVVTCKNLQLYAPAYETSGTLASVVKNLLTFDYDKPDECNDFGFGVAATPRATTYYATEHILELQTISSFIDKMSHDWGEKAFPSYQPGRSTTNNVQSFCRAIKELWSGVSQTDRFAMDGVTRDPVQYIMGVMPGNAAHVDEFVLLEQGVNTAKQQMWGDTEIHTDNTVTKYKQAEIDKLIKSIKDLISAMKYMQHPTVHTRLVDQKKRIAARLKELDEVKMPAFQKHTREEKWNKWTARGLEDAWNKWIRTQAEKAKSKAVKYIEARIKDLKDGYDSPTNRNMAEKPGEENAKLKTLLAKIDAIDAEWKRYKPISWRNPF